MSLFEIDRFVYNIDEDKYVEWKEKNSSINNIKDLRVPTMLIQSQ